MDDRIVHLARKQKEDHVDHPQRESEVAQEHKEGQFRFLAHLLLKKVGNQTGSQREHARNQRRQKQTNRQEIGTYFLRLKAYMPGGIPRRCHNVEQARQESDDDHAPQPPPVIRHHVRKQVQPHQYHEVVHEFTNRQNPLAPRKTVEQSRRKQHQHTGYIRNERQNARSHAVHPVAPEKFRVENTGGDVGQKSLHNFENKDTATSLGVRILKIEYLSEFAHGLSHVISPIFVHCHASRLCMAA